jgi:HD-like signal output (HDOD) protein
MSEPRVTLTLPDTSHRETMRVLFRRIAEVCDLPPLPAVAARALVVARDPDATPRALARLVATDAAIAARVLRIAHSPLYLRRTAPRSLEDAVLTLGVDTLRDILVAASARTIYRANDRVAQALWAHSLATALAADELGHEAREPRGGDAFIAGLLHDVGKVVFHLSDPRTFARLGDAADADEEGTFGVTHAAVGGCLAEQWGLDDAVVEAVMFHHTPKQSPLADRIAAADVLAEHIGFGCVIATQAPVPASELLPVEQRVVLEFEAQRALFD